MAIIKACLHCGLDTKDDREDFCCIGCASAYKIIHKLGFKNYYQLRKIDPKERTLKPEENCIDFDEFVTPHDDGSFSVCLMVQGIHCAACVWLIESLLKKQDHVLKARVNLSQKTLLLQWQGTKDQGSRIAQIIHDIGYKLLPFDEEILKEEEKKYDQHILKSLAVAGFGAGNVMFFSIILWIYGVENLGVGTRNLLHFFSGAIALPVVIYGARPFFVSAIQSLKVGYANMDLAIAIAISLACVVSVIQALQGNEHIYFDSAVMLTFFLLIGRYLDMKARKKAFSIATQFNILAASFGRVLQGDQIKVLPIKEIKKDMILMVGVGEKIAADGVVISGQSQVDASLINGEIMPRDVNEKDEVFAGSINLNHPLKIKVTKQAQHSVISKIIALSQEVENSKNNYVKLADRLARIYVPLVLLLGLATFGLWFFYFGLSWDDALIRAVCVLIITCPCALALAVPIVQTIAISSLIKKGVLVKSGQALERLREVDVVVFDKTGSLTLGKPQLVEVLRLDDGVFRALDRDKRQPYLKLAASLSASSKHPISQAIVKSYDGPLEALQIEEKKGFGLRASYEGVEVKLGRRDFCDVAVMAELDTKNYVMSFMKYGDETLLFLFLDALKEDAQEVVHCLKKQGREVILLSGDVKNNVAAIAKQVAIDHYYFEKTPLDKLQFLQDLKAQNKKILMVGDGINDAPALALADVSMSFCQATDIAQNIADIIIQGQKLFPIYSTVLSATKAISLMKQNLAIALIYNIVALPFAILGYVVPLVAALAMSSSSLLVLFNSLKMGRD